MHHPYLSDGCPSGSCHISGPRSSRRSGCVGGGGRTGSGGDGSPPTPHPPPRPRRRKSFPAASLHGRAESRGSGPPRQLALCPPSYNGAHLVAFRRPRVGVCGREGGGRCCRPISGCRDGQPVVARPRATAYHAASAHRRPVAGRSVSVGRCAAWGGYRPPPPPKPVTPPPLTISSLRSEAAASSSAAGVSRAAATVTPRQAVAAAAASTCRSTAAAATSSPPPAAPPSRVAAAQVGAAALALA